ncbi:hypothetical protein BC830DRAFT_1141278 [Chytriomyces sp. MP71]|nr:hypothetical protein BC830DRAFT_1141278 [Chytriomyces sp. MP71]
MLEQPSAAPASAQASAKTLVASEVADKFVTPSIGEEVIETTKNHKAPKRVIAVAVDGSPESQYALSWTLEHLANPAGYDQICILNVRPYAVPVHLFGINAPGDFMPERSTEFNEVMWTAQTSTRFSRTDSQEWVDAMERENRENSHNLLRKYGEQVLSRDVCVRAIALRGEPKEEILKKVDEIKPDMLVTGCRGLGALQKIFRGSLSDYLVQHATVPVIVPKMAH